MDAGKDVQFVCVRAAHHRHWAPVATLCEHLGCAAWCPAGDVGDHEWLPAATDIVGLSQLGYRRAARDAGGAEKHDADDDARVLIRG